MKEYKVCFEVFAQANDKEEAESIAITEFNQDTPAFATKVVKVVKIGNERKKHMTKKKLDRIIRESKDYLESRKKSSETVQIAKGDNK